jgi:hypothetical protein
MAGSSNIAAVPLANVKRKHKERDEDDDMDDGGSDVVRAGLRYGLVRSELMINGCFTLEHGQRRF